MKMIDQLKSIFGEQRVNICLSTKNRSDFLIAENNVTNQSFIVPMNNISIDEDKCFKIINATGKEIFHISIDECFLTQEHGYDGRKCDFVVFSDEKFCFVELKTNTVNKKQSRKKIKQAMEQLAETIDYFDENEVDFINHVLEAYIVLKNKIYPTDQASIKNRRTKFFNEYEVDLIEGSQTEF